jgi:hypothetical protein
LSNLNGPFRIKIYDDYMFILERDNDSIKKYNFNGTFSKEIIRSNRFGDITSFSVYKEYIWIVDLGGTRITQVDTTGVIREVKNDFCFMDVYFNFNRVVFIEAGTFFHDSGFYIADYGANYIIDIRYVIYE